MTLFALSLFLFLVFACIFSLDLYMIIECAAINLENNNVEIGHDSIFLFSFFPVHVFDIFLFFFSCNRFSEPNNTLLHC